MIACSMERDLFILDTDPVRHENGQTPRQATRSPPELGTLCPLLVASDVRFQVVAKTLRLTSAAAQILDDVQFLTTSILQSGTESLERTRIRNTASWLHGRLTQAKLNILEDEENLTGAAISQAAIIYTWAISSGKPMSSYVGQSLRPGLLASVQGVRLTRWKQIPGIYLWIVLVACSGVPGDMIGRFWRRKVAVATSAIAFENFPLGISCVSSFLQVQRWLADEEERAADGDEES